MGTEDTVGGDKVGGGAPRNKSCGHGSGVLTVYFFKKVTV